MPKEEFQVEITIAKPHEEIFKFISDANNLPLWSGASKVEVVVETVEKVGSEYRVTFSRFLSKYSVLIRIIEHTFPTNWSFQTQQPLGEFSYLLKEAEGGTKVTLIYKGEPIAPLFANLVTKHEIDKLLANLKNYLEKTYVTNPAEISPEVES